MTVLPEEGAVIVEVGGLVSVDFVAGTRPLCGVAG